MSRRLGYTDQLTDNLVNLGWEYVLRGDHEQATVLNEEVLALQRKHGRRGDDPYALDNLGWAALLRGDHERAEAFLAESLDSCRELGIKLIAAENLDGLACVAVASGNPGRAARIRGGTGASRGGRLPSHARRASAAEAKYWARPFSAR